MVDDREPESAANAPVECDDAHFGSYYYENCCGLPYERSPSWMGLFAKFAGHMATEIQPKSVLDAGCAMGLLVEALRDRDVDSFGVDISSYAISKVDDSIRDRCRVGSILEPFGRRYDLIVTIEVLEHLQPRDSERALANLCAHADDILFSSTPFDYKEATHFNVQPPEYWAELFQRHGFYRDLDYDASYITRWASRFRKVETSPARVVVGYERKLWRLTQENLGARESLVEHQENLVRAEKSLATANERLAMLEASTETFDERLDKIRASEAALADEFHRVVDAWANHVTKLDDQIRRTSSSQKELQKKYQEQVRMAEQAAHYAELAEQSAQQAAIEAEAARIERERYVGEAEEARQAEAAAIRDRDALLMQLAAVRASRSWRLANSLTGVKRWLRLDRSQEQPMASPPHVRQELPTD